MLETCHPDVALGSLDAIHLASAEHCRSWPLCSNDSSARAAAVKPACHCRRSPMRGHASDRFGPIADVRL